MAIQFVKNNMIDLIPIAKKIKESEEQNNKEIIEIMNQARSYKTDRDKTLPFTYRECKRTVEIALKSKEKEMLDNEINWLQSVLDTKHINEDSRWIIEGRISKLKGDKK